MRLPISPHPHFSFAFFLYGFQQFFFYVLRCQVTLTHLLKLKQWYPVRISNPDLTDLESAMLPLHQRYIGCGRRSRTALKTAYETAWVSGPSRDSLVLEVRLELT